MRRVSIAAVVLSISLLVQSWAAEDVETADDLAPDFVLKSLSGPNLRLSEYRGEVVVVAFWASWCGECRGALKAFGDVHAAYGSSGLNVLAVNLDRKVADARETSQALNLGFPVLHDPEGSVAELYDVRDVPFMVFVDREGRVRESIDGYSRSDEELFVDHLRSLLRE